MERRYLETPMLPLVETSSTSTGEVVSLASLLEPGVVC
jgi:hypothetical protein